MAFKAALFDMDGTLLDSMHVWAQVDDDFFAALGIVTPSDYGPALSGLSFQQSAEYTKQRFQLPESTEEIIAEWNRLCVLQYEQQVCLKPGAARYLRMLHRYGVKIAAATALPEHLFLPALKRAGVDHLFSAFATTSETGEVKRTGAVYRLAAQRLGVKAKDCIVFEDILDGHIGASAAGMRSCNVYDRYADHDRDAITATADFCTRDFSDAPKPDGFLPCSRAIIVPAQTVCDLDEICIHPSDYVIAADRGFVHLRSIGIEPDCIIGDFDSLLPGEVIPPDAIVHPAEKDDTDAALALRHALSLGFTRIIMAGGIGERIDHTLANLQLMRFAAARGAELIIQTSDERLVLLRPGDYTIAPFDEPRLLSLLAFSPRVENLTIRGAAYEAEDVTLTDDFPLGVSNSTLSGRPTRISFSAGLLLMIRRNR